ncbi:MAG: ArsB/NhaD family transporter, partial [Candidatus Zixiibacteriota bacterium]
MTASIVLFAICYLFIATEKVDKTIVVLLGAALAIVLQLIPYHEALLKVDLNVVFLLTGMMMIVNVLAQTGLFEWVAVGIVRKCRGNGVAIMASLMVVTAVFSALLDNVTTVILIAPITILIAQILEIPATPLLIAEALFSNIGGTSTLVGDPPNILIGSQGGLGFNDFLVNLAPVVGVIMIVALAVMVIWFRKRLTVGQRAKQRLARTRPDLAIIEPQTLKRALPVLGLVMLGFIGGRWLHIEPGIVALAGGVLMVLVCKYDLSAVIEHVEWNTVFFFIGLFMLVGSLEANGVFEELGRLLIDWTHGNLFAAALIILWSAAILSAIVDNVPLVVAMIPLIKYVAPAFADQMGITGMPEAIHAQVEAPLLWSLALGACLGGNGSIIGASANVVIVQVARRNRYKLSFWDFTRYGFPIMIISLV